MSSSRRAYHQRVLASLAAVMLLLTALVRWWPAPTAPEEGPFRARSPERISIREIQPTSQSNEQNPPPPAPLPPVVVPNDVVVTEDLDIGEVELRVETPNEDDRLQEGADTAPTAQAPDTDARLLKNVQPKYPAAAREAEVRARIEVEVQLSEEGRVLEAMVRRRWRLSESGSARPVSELGYGLEAAARAAARRSLFRPAQEAGRPVPSRTTLTFTFGPD